jgi:hypothetical protein
MFANLSWVTLQALLRQKERPWDTQVQSSLVHLELRKQRRMLSKLPV